MSHSKWFYQDAQLDQPTSNVFIYPFQLFILNDKLY